VIAEGFLTKNMEELEHLGTRIENLDHSEERRAETCRVESKGILKEFIGSIVDSSYLTTRVRLCSSMFIFGIVLP
jgi:hypothetical protein